MNAERIELRALAPQPWKNGAGVTRELARGGGGRADNGADDAFDWRISGAEVARDAPFSAFPGIDRCIVLLRGAGLRLHARDGTLDHALITPLVPLRFAGETPLDATLLDGPCDDLNVMTRRGAFTSEVRVHHSAGALDRPCDATLLLAVEGHWVVGADTLAPLQALLWRATPTARISWRLAGDGTRHSAGSGIEPALLTVCLCHDRRP